MTTITMTKDGQTIRINSALLAQHKQLGWQVDTLSTLLANADITVGAEGTDTINVSIQLQDNNGAALAEGRALLAYLADSASDLVATTDAPSGHVATGTNGGCIHLVTDAVFLLNTNTSGVVDVNIIESGADTWYLVLIMPNGERVVSSAITFA